MRRRCVADGTSFGAHIKFKDAQRGAVDGVLFEHLNVTRLSKYAVGINQNGQKYAELPSPPTRPPLRSNVTIRDVRFASIKGDAPVAGFFECNAGALACLNVSVADLDVLVPSPSRDGCMWQNVYGTHEGMVRPVRAAGELRATARAAVLFTTATERLMTSSRRPRRGYGVFNPHEDA